jgi:hypothetical protein
MKLTFSANDILDASDNFVIFVPLANNAAQWIGPTQTLLKTEHYYASSLRDTCLSDHGTSSPRSTMTEQ